MWICIAPRRDHTSKVLRYGTRSPGISQFYLHTMCTCANWMNHTCLPSRDWYSFTDPGGIEDWVGPYTTGTTTTTEIVASTHIFYPFATETADTRDRQMYLQHHRGQQWNNILIPTAVHGTSKEKCGLFPEDHDHQMKHHCSHLHLAWFQQYSCLQDFCWSYRNND